MKKVIKKSKITGFKFSMGGFNEGTVWLEQDDNNIIIRCNNCNDDGIYKPSQEDWEIFSTSVNKLTFWKWKKNYIDSRVCDGTQWELSIQEDSKNMKCYGSNNYPQDFNKLVSSVNQLINSDVFNTDVVVPKIRLVRKPRKCRECGSDSIARIQYGYPNYTPELEKKILEGQVTLGGCCQEYDAPAWECVECECLFYRKSDLDSDDS